MKTLTAQHQDAAEIALAHFREMFLLAFSTMTEGLAQQYRRDAKAILDFFSEETDANVWAQLTMVPDSENPARSLADAWLEDWQRLAAATGKEAV